ncbi:MAG: zinc ABC transporter substrate-binding protein [Verrucomicrobiota bacterium]
MRRGVFIILFSLAGMAQAERKLTVYAPAPFTRWLIGHIGGDSINIYSEIEPEIEYDLQIFLDSQSQDKNIESARAAVFLGDGLPKLEIPDGLESLPENGIHSWLYLQNTLFMAVNLGDILSELLPEKAETYYAAVSAFNRTIRLADFQIKKQLRSLETPLILNQKQASTFFPYFLYYEIDYRIADTPKPQLNLDVLESGDDPAAPFELIANQLLNSE